MTIQPIRSDRISKKKLFIRRFWLALAILVFSVVQNTDGLFPTFFGTRALILIPLVTAAAMYERDISGILFGLFAGALWDITADGSSFNAVFLVIVGYTCGTLINTIMRNNFITHLILSAFSVGIYNLGYWIFHFIAPGLDKSFFMLMRFYFVSSLYTAILSPLIFFFVRWIENHYREKDFTL